MYEFMKNETCGKNEIRLQINRLERFTLPKHSVYNNKRANNSSLFKWVYLFNWIRPELVKTMKYANYIIFGLVGKIEMENLQYLHSETFGPLFYCVKIL